MLIDPILPVNPETAARMERRLRRAVSPHERPEKRTLTPGTLEPLRGLGYVEK
jgi:hypothetical protein